MSPAFGKKPSTLEPYFLKNFEAIELKMYIYNIYIYSLKGLGSPRASHFPKFSENVPFMEIVFYRSFFIFNFFMHGKKSGKLTIRAGG